MFEKLQLWRPEMGFGLPFVPQGQEEGMLLSEGAGGIY